MKLITIISMTFLISSCATMSAKECKVADWKNIGYNDALDGHSFTELEDHRDACKKAKVTPNKSLYLIGYKKGEIEYCTYDNGVIAGEKRKYVSKICNTPALKEFHHGYFTGKKRYEKLKKIKHLNNQLDTLELKIIEIKQLKSKDALKEIDFAYREKELINREILILEFELDNIR